MPDSVAGGMSRSATLAERLDLRRLYETMVLIRLFEPEAERQYKQANIGGYCHLSTGQEAATVGAVAPLGAEDYLLMSYRTHGLVLARGTPPETVMAELFGREGAPRVVVAARCTCSTSGGMCSAAGASSAASSPSRPASPWRWFRRAAGAPCSGSWGTARSTWARGTSR